MITFPGLFLTEKCLLTIKYVFVCGVVHIPQFPAVCTFLESCNKDAQITSIMAAPYVGGKHSKAAI